MLTKLQAYNHALHILADIVEEFNGPLPYDTVRTAPGIEGCRTGKKVIAHGSVWFISPQPTDGPRVCASDWSDV